MTRITSSLLLCLTLQACAYCAPATRLAAVDATGVLRWQDDNSEVALFGVNYYVPFSIDYKVLTDRGLDHDRAIREDVTHFQRLGLDAIRLHCFDREISDHAGNLRDNEHLRLLDYLLNECKQRGIYSVMTPVAWWGSPEKGGFSDLYTMPQMTTDPAARQAQCTYLKQYLNHVNRYTGLAYKDDPAIVALELINEPLYPPGITDEQITEHVNALTRAARETGCTKPVFYNCWGTHAAAVGKAELNGATFGWYPTGLVAGHMLTRNYLPQLDDYPSMRDPQLAAKAKIVYEFDAADVPGAYMYPAMARAFRSGGAQTATQFQYEPLCIAAGNPNWQTHYLNLVYTPGKALSFAIASQAFHSTPRLKQFGSYPDSAKFGDFRVSYEEDLSEWVTPEAFCYSNNTKTDPPAPERLTRVWGRGSSSVVRYEGTGAYFLDRVAPGVWEMQVYPDAVMVADPYVGGTNEKVRALYHDWEMQVRLPDLGSQFFVRPAASEGPERQAADGKIVVAPGQYLLSSGRLPANLPPTELPAFVAPPASAADPAVYLATPKRWRERRPLALTASVAATDVDACTLHVRPAGADGYSALPLTATGAYRYQTTVPAESVKAGKLRYFVTVRTKQGAYRFPGGALWSGAEPAAVPAADLVAVKEGTPVPKPTYGGPAGASARAEFVPGQTPEHLAIRLEADRFGDPPSCAGIRVPAVRPTGDLSRYHSITVVARGGPETSAVELGLVQSDGNTFGAEVPLGPTWGEVTMPLRSLHALWDTKTAAPDLSKLTEVSLIFGSWLFPEAKDRPHFVEVQSVRLSSTPNVWTLEVASDADPIRLVDPVGEAVRLNGHAGTVQTVRGAAAGRQALRASVASFAGQPDSSSFRLEVDPSTDLYRDELPNAMAVLLTARAAQPDTTQVELVLIEQDGSPWGTTVSLTRDWQTIRLPVTAFRYFAHWRPPQGDRGGEGDHLRPAEVRQVNFCFGAWLFGDKADKPHAFEVQDVCLDTLR